MSAHPGRPEARTDRSPEAICSDVTPEARAWYKHLSARGTIPLDQERGYRLWHELRMYACHLRR